MHRPVCEGVQRLPLGLEADDAAQRVGVLQERSDYLLIVRLIGAGQAPKYGVGASFKAHDDARRVHGPPVSLVENDAPAGRDHLALTLGDRLQDAAFETPERCLSVLAKDVLDGAARGRHDLVVGVAVGPAGHGRDLFANGRLAAAGKPCQVDVRSHSVSSVIPTPAGRLGT